MFSLLRGRKRLGLPARLAIAAGALLVTVLAVELFLRAIGYDPLSDALTRNRRMVRPSARSEQVYELVPGATGQGWGTDVHINGAGFRDREYATGKGERYRLVALGDSITFGNNLRSEETWPEELERRLQGVAQGADVLNLGVPGYDSCQEVAFLEEVGVRFAPDLVVVGFCANDLGIVSVTLTQAFAHEDAERWFFQSRILQWISTLRAESERARRAFLLGVEESYAELHAREILPLDGDPELARRMGELEQSLAESRLAGGVRRILGWYASPARIGRLKFAFDWLARLSRERGFEVVVLLIPVLQEDTMIREGFGIVAHLAGTFGFEVIDVDGSFREAGFERLRITQGDPFHPNALGHVLLAAALEEHVRARLQPLPED